MAKKSIVEREKKRRLLSEKFLLKREDLKVKIGSVNSFEQKIDYQSMLQKLPRSSSPSRKVCFFCYFIPTNIYLFNLSKL